MDRLTIPDEYIDGGMRRAIIDAREVRKHAMMLYWQLKKYEDTGVTPEQLKIIDEEYSRMAHELAMLRQQNLKSAYKVGDVIYCIEKYEDGFEYSGYRYLGECGEYIMVSPTFVDCADFSEQLREMACENSNEMGGDVFIFHKENAYRTKEEANAAVDRLKGDD